MEENDDKHLVPDPYPKVYLYRRIVQAKLYIDRQYAENIDLDNIADEAYFSKFHFIRLFSQIYGKTPHQYLKQVWMEHALLQLEAGHSITDTCFLVGFTSLRSFSGLFKRWHGSPPATNLFSRISAHFSDSNIFLWPPIVEIVILVGRSCLKFPHWATKRGFCRQ